MKWPLLIEAVFFDLDDTLCANNSAIAKAREDTIDHILSKSVNQDRRSIREMYDSIFSEQEKHIGKLSNRPEVFRNGFEFRLDRFKRLLQGMHIPDMNMAAELTKVYGESKIRNLRAFPEIPQILLTLRRSYSLGIITNGFSDLQNEELDALGLRGFFEHVIISQEVGMQKPDKGIFLEALRRTSVQTDRFLMIGNNLKDDVLTPRELGMHAGLVLHGRKADNDSKNNSDFMIENLNFLPDLVRRP